MQGSIDPVALAQALIRCPSVTPADAGALDALAGALAAGRLRLPAHAVRGAGDGADRQSLRQALRQAARQAFQLRRPFRRGAGRQARGLERRSVRGGDHRRPALWPRRRRHEGRDRGLCRRRPRASSPGHGGDFAGAISLLITGDEEGPSVNGTKPMLQALAAEGERFDACLVGEPTNPKRLGEMAKIGRRGSWTGHLTVKGVQGHIAYPHLADNPTHRLARMIVRADRDAARSRHRAFRARARCRSPPSMSAIRPPTSSRPKRAPASTAGSMTASIRQSLEAEVRRRLETVGGDYELRVECSGVSFVTPPGPLERPGQRRGQGRDRPDAGAFAPPAAPRMRASSRTTAR